jgi:glycosyltransferase involved in cell wall biosynthesis
MLMQNKLIPAPAPGRPLRVLFALPGRHRVVRGAEVALEELARHLACIAGFEVSVIGSGQARLFEPYHYKRARCVPREWFERFPSVPYLRDHYSYEELSFAPALFMAYRPRDFDITVTCGYPYTSWVLRQGRKGWRPRHVYVTQNGDWMCHAKNWEYRHFSCDGLVCTNPDYYARAADCWPSVLIPNGVNPTVFEPGKADHAEFGLPAYGAVVLMVSALIPSKRVLDGIRAVAKLPGVHLVIAGSGEMRDEVAALGQRLLPGRFALLNVPRSRMPSLYRCADVFLHMSQDEPSANAYVEALASGLTIVTHDRNVTRWTLEDTAVYVNTSSIDDVVRGIQEAVRYRTPADVARRREIVHRRFSWSQIANEYGEFFRKVCGAPASRVAQQRMEVAR